MQQELIAGDSLSFLTTVPDYPATDGWSLFYRLVPRTVGNTPIQLSTTVDGADYRVAEGAVTTAAWASDNYTWTSWVDKAGEIYTVDSGQISVRPNPRTAVAGTDGRSQAEKALADAKTAYAGWTPTQRKYRIGDREMEFASKADIVGTVSFWEIQVKRERTATALAKGLPDPRKTYVRINRE